MWSVVALALLAVCHLQLCVHGISKGDPYRLGDRCTNVIDLICGSDGITYTNSCFFETAKLTNMDLGHGSFGKHCDSINKNCVRTCDDYESPVCGTDNETYKNLCYLQNQICFNPKLSLQSFTDCDSIEKIDFTKTLVCNKYCGNRKESYCGSDGTIYQNRCFLEVAKCYDKRIHAIRQGDCTDHIYRHLTPSILACIKTCDMVLDPVCSEDNVTYDNLCSFENARCKNDKLKLKAHKPCRDLSGINSKLLPFKLVDPAMFNVSQLLVHQDYGVAFENDATPEQVRLIHGDVASLKDAFGRR